MRLTKSEKLGLERANRCPKCGEMCLFDTFREGWCRACYGKRMPWWHKSPTYQDAIKALGERKP